MSHAELRPDIVALVVSFVTGDPTVTKVTAEDCNELARSGIMSELGRPFSAASMNSMLAL
jgi:hypothetical protein